jgi:outer membrane protein OmpA-like peptidoglycan-associated protein
MLLFRKVLLIAMLGTIGACTTQPTIPSIEFNYKVENATAAGIVQVFDMTGNTIVQLRGIESKSPLFLDEKQTEIKFHVVGQTAVLAGVHQTFTVVSGMTSSKVTRISNGKLAVSTAMVVVASPAVKQEPTTTVQAATTDAEMLSLLTAMKAELEALKKQVANSAPDGGRAGERQQRYAALASSKAISSVRVQFKDNSSDFEPKAGIATTLVDLTKDASEISITGYTDSAKATPASLRLAKARAEAAGKFLVSRGVDIGKINVSFRPAGGFIAENTTREGREQNRRVEIEII